LAIFILICYTLIMSMKIQQKAEIITLPKLKQRRLALPESLLKAAGLLRRNKSKELERHVNRMRLEWNRPAKA